MLFKDIIPFICKEDDIELTVLIGNEVFTSYITYKSDELEKRLQVDGRLLNSEIFSIGVSDMGEILKVVLKP